VLKLKHLTSKWVFLAPTKSLLHSRVVLQCYLAATTPLLMRMPTVTNLTSLVSSVGSISFEDSWTHDHLSFAIAAEVCRVVAIVEQMIFFSALLWSGGDLLPIYFIAVLRTRSSLLTQTHMCKYRLLCLSLLVWPVHQLNLHLVSFC